MGDKELQIGLIKENIRLINTNLERIYSTTDVDRLKTIEKLLSDAWWELIKCSYLTSKTRDEE